MLSKFPVEFKLETVIPPITIKIYFVPLKSIIDGILIVYAGLQKFTGKLNSLSTFLFTPIRAEQVVGFVGEFIIYIGNADLKESLKVFLS